MTTYEFCGQWRRAPGVIIARHPREYVMIRRDTLRIPSPTPFPLTLGVQPLGKICSNQTDVDIGEVVT